MYFTVFGLLSTSLFNMLSFYFELMPKKYDKKQHFLAKYFIFHKTFIKILYVLYVYSSYFFIFKMTAKNITV